MELGLDSIKSTGPWSYFYYLFFQLVLPNVMLCMFHLYTEKDLIQLDYIYLLLL